MTVLGKTPFHIGQSIVYLEKLCKKIFKLLKKSGQDPDYVTLLLEQIKSKKEEWHSANQLNLDLDDCEVCEFFERIHTRLIEELMDGVNGLIQNPRAAGPTQS